MPCWTNLQFLCGYSAPEGCNLVAKFSDHIALTSITFQLSKHQRISCQINANKCYNDYYLQPWHNVFIDLERTLLQRCCNVSVPVGSFLIYNNKATWKIKGTHGKNLHNFFFFFCFLFEKYYNNSSTSHDPDKVIFIFSSHTLNDHKKFLLCKGLNFAISPKNITYRG